jgi:protein-disulfide isomerase-like protein with CxxC motif
LGCAVSAGDAGAHCCCLCRPEQKFKTLKAIQKTSYIEGGDVTDIATLANAAA